MCTRYYMELSPELRPIIETARRSPLRYQMVDKLEKVLKTEGEIRPTDMVPVIAPEAAVESWIRPDLSREGVQEIVDHSLTTIIAEKCS